MNQTIQRLSGTVEIEAIVSKDKTSRYLITKCWNKTLPKALVIMLHPTDFNDVLLMDVSTYLATNETVKLGFGTIMVANLFSCCQTEKNKNLSECTNDTNDQTILSAAKDATKIIMAFGRNTTNKAIVKRKEEVLRLLSPYKDKMFEISDGDKSGYHPLSPKARKNQWNLAKINTDGKKPDSQHG